jgi:3-phenylpropionate/trans-cinnamate dioxygenase ferredoxin reductase component
MPSYRKDLVMSDSKYVIVGGGMAADAAVRGIREVDANGSISLISAEGVPPYKRPPLSKGLWNGKPLNRIWSKTGELDVDLHLGRTVLKLDTDGKRVIDDHGNSYRFEKLLLATGVVPRRLSPGHDDGVIYFRTVEDYRRLRELADQGERFAVIGGGFLGSEIAASLAANGKQVTMIFPGCGIGDRIFPRDLSLSLNELYRERGVDVRAGETIAGLERRGDTWIVRMHGAGGGAVHEVTVDGVVAGVGTRAALDLAHSGGLETGDGIIVDEYLRTSHPDVYAAGDVANTWMPALGKRLRVEHEDNARTMGRHAGRSMAGRVEPYHHLPFFYSDLFELGYEAVGELDARFETVAHWYDPFREGIVYYLRDGRVRGVLLWNVWNQVDTARDLIGQPVPQDLDLTRESVLVTD